MLRQATLTNFTTLPNERLSFAPGLNVVVAENGCGKTHLMKALYCLMKVNADSELTKTALQKEYADKLMSVFRPDKLGRLVKRKQGRERCEVILEMTEAQHNCAINFASNASNTVQVEQVPTASLPLPPIYLPTRELLTLCPWFVGLVDNFTLKFESTWRDTCSLLAAPALRGAREKATAELMEPLEQAMGGKVITDSVSGEFYLQQNGQKLEMPLVAEGVRKLAMVARMIATGVIQPGATLFWDEPEANLNPKLIRAIANVLFELAQRGVQIILATHSFFLMKELQMLADAQAATINYFSLVQSDEGVALNTSDRLDTLEGIVALDEELAQFDREQELSLG